MRPLLRGRPARYRGIFHAIVVAFALQVSGFGHAIADVVGYLEHEEHDDPDCADGGDDCPPGCPDCHCTHAASLTVTAALGEPFEFVTSIDFAPVHGTRPSKSFVGGVYRPPRV